MSVILTLIVSIISLFSVGAPGEIPRCPTAARFACPVAVERPPDLLPLPPGLDRLRRELRAKSIVLRAIPRDLRHHFDRVQIADDFRKVNWTVKF